MIAKLVSHFLTSFFLKKTFQQVYLSTMRGLQRSSTFSQTTFPIFFPPIHLSIHSFTLPSYINSLIQQALCHIFYLQSNYFDSLILSIKSFSPKKPHLPRRCRNLSNFQLQFKAPPPIPFTPILIPSKSWWASFPLKSYSFCFTQTTRKLPWSSI